MLITDGDSKGGGGGGSGRRSCPLSAPDPETGRLMEELDSLAEEFLGGGVESVGSSVFSEGLNAMDYDRADSPLTGCFEFKDELPLSSLMDDQILIPGLEDDTRLSFNYLTHDDELDFDAYIKSEPVSPPLSSDSSPPSVGGNWMSLDVKSSAPETPPITPPQPDASPPTSPLPNVSVATVTPPQPQMVTLTIPVTHQVPAVKRERQPPSPCSKRPRLVPTQGTVTILPALSPIKKASENGRVPSCQQKQQQQPLQPLVMTAVDLAKLTQQGVLQMRQAPVVQTQAPVIPLAPQGIKQEVDPKAVKRQQRMIKNRESACLSRQKKREHVQRMEQQVSCLKEENQRLKEENSELRVRVQELVDDNQRLKGLPRVVSGSRGVTVAQIFSPATRKATAIFSVFLLLSFHLSSLGGIFVSQQQQQKQKSILEQHSLQPHLLSTVGESPHVGRALLWTSDLSGEERAGMDGEGNSSHPICPLPVNKSESLRLNSELRDWFRVPDGLQASHPPPPPPPSPALRSTRVHSPSPPSPSLPQQHRHELVHPSRSGSVVSGELSPKFHGYLLGRRGDTRRVRDQAQHDQELQLYDKEDMPSRLVYYAAFLEEIDRKEDTFYVVSFSGDHLLLPALEVNHTSRPKMALVMPVPSPQHPANSSHSSRHSSQSINGTMPAQVAMMQIECEVTNTRLLHVNEESVPQGRPRSGKRGSMGGGASRGNGGKMQVRRRRGAN